MESIEKLKEVHGEVVELTTPSGYKVVIRQQNGEDDDILSNAITAVDGSSANNFVAAIVVGGDFTPNGKLTKTDVMKMKLADKYFIMIASRIFSLGQFVKFEYDWGEHGKHEYDEDLANYIWQYENDNFPAKGDPDYFQYRIKPHKGGKQESKEFTLSNGKTLMYDYMNGFGEKWLMTLPLEKTSKNNELLARNLKQLINDDWIKVQNFRTFTAMEMVEIRKEIFEYDPVLELISEVENPVTREKGQISIVATADFFFPREI